MWKPRRLNLGNNNNLKLKLIQKLLMPSMKKQVNLVLPATMRTTQPKKQFYNLGLRADKEQDSRKVLSEYVNSKLNIPVSETDSDTAHQTRTRKSARQSETGRCNHSNILIAHLHD